MKTMQRLPYALFAGMLFLVSACQQKMADQPSYRPHEPSAFFEDERAARPLVAGTIARGHLRTDKGLYLVESNTMSRAFPAAVVASGFSNPLHLATIAGTQPIAEEQFQTVDQFPFPVTQAVLEHGRNRFMIYCVVCHDPLGTGNGMIVQRGYTKPPSYHVERLRTVPVGHFYRVMTLGYGSMPSYAKQVPPRDRWAIAAYVRALQLSQHFPREELTDGMRRDWDAQKNAGSERSSQ